VTVFASCPPALVVGCGSGVRWANLIAQGNESALSFREQAPLGVHADEFAAVRSGVEAPQPARRVRLQHQVAGGGGGNRVPLDQGRFGAAAQQGVGFPSQCGVDGDTLGDREQRGQSCHRIGRGPQAHPPVVGCVAEPVHEPGGVEPVGGSLRLGLDPPVPERLQLWRKRGIDGGPVLACEPGGFAGHDHGPPLAGPAGFQLRERGGQLRGEDPGPAEIAAGLEVRDPTRQPDLGGDAAVGTIRRDARVQLCLPQSVACGISPYFQSGSALERQAEARTSRPPSPPTEAASAEPSSPSCPAGPSLRRAPTAAN
jgi:hypothetical protein